MSEDKEKKSSWSYNKYGELIIDAYQATRKDYSLYNVKGQMGTALTDDEIDILK